MERNGRASSGEEDIFVDGGFDEGPSRLLPLPFGNGLTPGARHHPARLKAGDDVVTISVGSSLCGQIDFGARDRLHGNLTLVDVSLRFTADSPLKLRRPQVRGWFVGPAYW